MTSDTQQSVPPNDALASLVANKLNEEACITTEKVAEVLNKLKAGTATSQDWRLWIELLIQSKKDGGSDGKN
ncbi:MAG: hypothetical protein Q8K29_17170 [Polaromonas sp.]|nr:hypothetical protein [Polaromonas sp.]